MSKKFAVHFKHDVFRSTDSVDKDCASNNGVGQFKPIFQVEGNTFRPIFFGYCIADWLLYDSAAASFQTTKLHSRLYSTEIQFTQKTEKLVFEPPFA